MCVKCKIEKTVDMFSVKPTKLGHSKECKKCWSEYMKTYYKNNPNQYNKHKGYVKINDSVYKTARWRHGLTKEKFDELWNKFDGLCWSCQENPANAIDHDHSCCPTNQANRRTCGDCVRGLLCNGCNTSLGLLKESKQRILRLVDYLDTYGSSNG